MITNPSSKEDLKLQIQENLSELNNLQNVYNTKLQIFSTCLQNINNEIQKNMKKEEIDFFMSLLSKSKTSLDFLRKQKNLIVESTSILSSIQEETDNAQDNSTPKDKIEKFNKLYKDCTANYCNHSNDTENLILDYINSSILKSQPIQEQMDTQSNGSNSNSIETSKVPKEVNCKNDSLTNTDIEVTASSSKKKNKSNSKDELQQSNISENNEAPTPTKIEYQINENEDNTTLLISEIQNKVVLPYKISELKRTLKHNKNYNSIQELVNDKYIFPLNNFKNSSTSRFKEGFALMRKKEKASLLDSLDLAFEVTFKNSLNPAVIAACNNLIELDTYLDCLESNNLDKFNCFDIKYEMLPTKTD